MYMGKMSLITSLWRLLSAPPQLQRILLQLHVPTSLQSWQRNDACRYIVMCLPGVWAWWGWLKWRSNLCSEPDSEQSATVRCQAKSNTVCNNGWPSHDQATKCHQVRMTKQPCRSPTMSKILLEFPRRVKWGQWNCSLKWENSDTH